MSKKKTQKIETAETTAQELVDFCKEHGFREIWAFYPFREGKLFSNYAPGEEPKYGRTRRPDDATIKRIKSVIKAPLTLESLQTFLQTRCNAQNLDGWTWKHILWALYHYQQSDSVNSESQNSKPLKKRTPSKEALALAALADDPKRTDDEVATIAGCNRGSLYRFKRFMLARAAIQSGRNDIQKGSKYRGKIDEEEHNHILEKPKSYLEDDED